MDRLEFRIDDLTERELRRIRARSNAGSPVARAFFNALNASAATPFGWAGALILIGAALSIADGAGVFDTTHVINGVSVLGSRVLVVEDNSGSMGSVAGELASQKARFGPSLFNNDSTIAGFGVVSTGADNNLLKVVARVLPAHRDADAVYVFSDFYPIDYDIDCNDAAGLEQFRQVIRRAGVRLYLSTVSMRPSPGLEAIARESGGAVIGISPVESAARRQTVCRFDR